MALAVNSFDPVAGGESSRVLDQLGLNEREANDLVESYYEEISIALETGESVNVA